MAFLDERGLSFLWTKIKSYVQNTLHGHDGTGTLTSAIPDGTQWQNECVRRGDTVSVQWYRHSFAARPVDGTVCTLPEGYRPSSARSISCSCFVSSGTWVSILCTVEPNGEIRLGYSGTITCTYCMIWGTFVI